MEIVWMTIACKITYRLIAIRWERLNDYTLYVLKYTNVCISFFFKFTVIYVTACTMGRFIQNVRHNIMHNIFL